MKSYKFNTKMILFFLTVFSVISVNGQASSAIKTILGNNSDSVLQDISGDGRFAVLGSRGDLSTVPGNKNNSDGNYEFFLFDYAQRHIFQITNTKDLLIDPNGSSNEENNIKMHMNVSQARMSNDGKFIVFTSMATTSTPAVPNSTNPGNFDANSHSSDMLANANYEIWSYELPAYAFVNMSDGIEPTFVNIAAGAFRQLTNSNPYSPGFDLYWDNSEPEVNDNGCVVSFQSILNHVQLNSDFSKEIFVWLSDAPSCGNFPDLPSRISQVTSFAWGGGPLLFVGGQSLSGDGRRIAFYSSANNVIRGMTNGSNDDFNLEVFVSDLGEDGNPNGSKLQVTNTTNPPIPPGGIPVVVNVFTVGGKRISRNGRYLVLDSLAQLDQSGGGSNIQSSYAVFLYDFNQPSGQRFKKISPRGLEDPALSGTNPDISNIPVFTDYDSNKEPATVLFTSRMNMTSSGTIPVNPADGMNPSSYRQGQIYSYSIASSTPTFSRLTNPSTTDYAPCRAGGSPFYGYFAYCWRAPIASNSSSRVAYSQEISYINNVQIKDIDYLLSPAVTLVVPSVDYNLTYFAGGSDMTVSGGNPEAVGLSANMLGSVMLPFTHMTPEPVSTIPTGISTARKFNAPIELRGARVSVDGYAAQLRGIRKGQIDFIIPTEVGTGAKPFVVNYKGKLFQGTLNIVDTQPDVLRTQACPCPPGGRTKIFNVTEPNNPQPEPFSVLTQTPNGTEPTKLRAYITGIKGASWSSIGLQIGTVPVPSILANPVESDFPGVYTVDFILPTSLAGAGDVPLIVTNTINGLTAQSRPAATAATFRIDPNSLAPTDLAVWRTSSGTWYVSNGQGGIQAALQWGLSSDIPVPGDYDGDGKTDFCVFRSSNGAWYMVKSSDGSIVITSFGLNGDKPAPADYDGDGKTDYAVYRESNTSWYVYSSFTGQQSAENMGISSVDALIPADYDADGKADYAFWIKKDAKFLVWNRTQSLLAQTNFGQSGDKPVVGDYDGDGKADFATWRDTDNIWRILHSSNGQQVNIAWGDITTDIAVPGDYDADGKTDIAVWRNSGPYAGYWFIRKSSNGQMRADLWGMTGDIPVPAPYHR